MNVDHNHYTLMLLWNLSWRGGRNCWSSRDYQHSEAKGLNVKLYSIQATRWNGMVAIQWYIVSIILQTNLRRLITYLFVLCLFLKDKEWQIVVNLLYWNVHCEFCFINIADSNPLLVFYYYYIWHKHTPSIRYITALTKLTTTTV